MVYNPTWWKDPEDDLQKEIVTDIVSVSVQDLFYKPFMSKSDLGMVKTKYKSAGSGLQDILTLRRNIDYKTLYYDEEILVGKEEDIEHSTDEIKYYEPKLQPVKFELKELKKYASPIDFKSEVSPSLQDAHKNSIEYTMAGLPTFLDGGKVKAPYYNHGTLDVKPVYDRIVFPVTANAQPTRAEYNDNGGGGHRQISGANGMTRSANLVDPAVQWLNVEQLKRARQFATQGGATPEAENRILPAIVKMDSSLTMNEHIVIVDPAQRNQLERDPLWKDHAYRGVLVKDAPENLTGSRYAGYIRGMHVYENDWMTYHRLVDNGQTYAFGMLVGRMALYAGFCGSPHMLHQEYNYGQTVGFTIAEIRGFKSLSYDSMTTPNKRAEFGIIFLPSNITNFI